MESNKYSFELWTAGGELLIDLSGKAKRRRVLMSRNEAEEITFYLDLDDFEEFARQQGLNARDLVVDGQTEVRVKRGSEYLCGGQIVYSRVELTSGANSLEIRATGFLNLFAKRYTSDLLSFSGDTTADIAWGLIDYSQNLPDGDYGVTQGLVATIGNHDRNYKRTNIKNALQALTEIQTDSIDIEFTYDKVFNTYSQMGSNRPEIRFTYPGNLNNFALSVDATNITNEVTALGAGIGDESTVVIAIDDSGSKATHKLRQEIITTNGTDDSDGGVTDAGNSYVEAYKFPIEVLELEVDGNLPPYITDYGLGDYVRVEVQGYDMLNHVGAMYRIEKIDLSIDDDDNETIRLFVT